MNRLMLVILNLILITVGFFIVYASPLSALAITFGMLLIAASIISFAILIYFPPVPTGYVKLKVIEESPKAPRLATRKKPKKRSRRRKR